MVKANYLVNKEIEGRASKCLFKACLHRLHRSCMKVELSRIASQQSLSYILVTGKELILIEFLRLNHSDICLQE